jgi:hypothetical protein
MVISIVYDSGYGHTARHAHAVEALPDLPLLWIIRDFDTYRSLRIHKMPTGVGEPDVPPLARSCRPHNKPQASYPPLQPTRYVP